MCCCDRITADMNKWSVHSFGILGGAIDGGPGVTANKTARVFDYAKQCVSHKLRGTRCVLLKLLKMNCDSSVHTHCTICC